MQAPTTPSGPPAQEPDEHPCAGCGASNARSSAFCWRCYRPFAAVGAPQTGWTPPGAQGGAALGPSASPFVVEPSSGGIGTMIAVVVGTLAVVGAAWFLFFRDGAVALPETFGGMPRIQDAQTQLVEDTFQTQVEANGIDGDMAVYGNGVPSAALIWIRDASVPTTDDAFDEFASGFNEGIGASGSLGNKQTQSTGGVTFVCAPVLGATPATICMWQGDDLFWLMFDFSGGSFTEGRGLAVEAYNAVATGSQA